MGVTNTKVISTKKIFKGIEADLRAEATQEMTTIESKDQFGPMFKEKKVSTSFPQDSTGIGCLYLINYSSLIPSKKC